MKFMRTSNSRGEHHYHPCLWRLQRVKVANEAAKKRALADHAAWKAAWLKERAKAKQAAEDLVSLKQERCDLYVQPFYHPVLNAPSMVVQC